MILLCVFIAFLLSVASVFFLLPLCRHHNKLFLLCVSCIFSLATIGLYCGLGNSTGYRDFLFAQSQKAEIAHAVASLRNPQTVIAMIKNRLQTQPNDAKGWYLIGRLYFSQQDLPDALDAFSHAQKLQPDNLDVLFQLAQALYFSQHNQLTLQARQYLDQILKSDPNNIDALNLFAVAAYTQHDYLAAIRYWERLLNLFPAGSDDAKILISAIANAQRALTASRST